LYLVVMSFFSSVPCATRGWLVLIVANARKRWLHCRTRILLITHRTSRLCPMSWGSWGRPAKAAPPKLRSTMYDTHYSHPQVVPIYVAILHTASGTISAVFCSLKDVRTSMRLTAYMEKGYLAKRRIPLGGLLNCASVIHLVGRLYHPSPPCPGPLVGDFTICKGR
jgi:hypothetical protein